jgi:hypothetical protein
MLYEIDSRSLYKDSVPGLDMKFQQVVDSTRRKEVKGDQTQGLSGQIEWTITD